MTSVDTTAARPLGTEVTLKAAVELIESFHADILEDTLKGGTTYEVSSGGSMVVSGVSDPLRNMEKIRALWSGPELAIEEWKSTMMEFLRVNTVWGWRWVARPKIEEFQMTIADKRQTQRVVTDRWHVHCTIQVHGESIVTS